MKNQRTAGLYDPYLDVMGGGEKHILSILQVLEKEGYDISLFWNQNLTSSIKNKLNLQFKTLHLFQTFLLLLLPVEKIKVLKNFDLFFYVTDGSYFVSSAKKISYSAWFPISNCIT